MAKRKRRAFTREFKAQAVRIVREELGRLRRENRTLRMERDILKNFRARRGPPHLLDEKLGARLR